jgi:peptidoglycan/LPS O-acetylase OafA/YrhL
VKLIRIITWCVYAVLFAALYFFAAGDNVSLGYPSAFVALSATCAALNFSGVIAYAFDLRSQRIRKWARIVFPVLVLELALGLLMDAFLPEDYNLRKYGLVWLRNAAFMLLLVSPAFYANYRLAYRPRNGA